MALDTLCPIPAAAWVAVAVFAGAELSEVWQGSRQVRAVGLRVSTPKGTMVTADCGARGKWTCFEGQVCVLGPPTWPRLSCTWPK